MEEPEPLLDPELPLPDEPELSLFAGAAGVLAVDDELLLLLLEDEEEALSPPPFFGDEE